MDSQSPTTRPAVRSEWPVLLVALLVAAAMLGLRAGTGSLVPSDDAIYAQVAREILADGRFPDLTWQGVPFFEKGPLLFWALAGSQAALGPTMLAVRLPGVLAGLALLAGLYAVARRLGLGRNAALTALGALLATSLFYFNARRPMTDVPGAALGLAGFWALAFPGRSVGATRARAVLGGGMLGLAALCKLVAPVPFVLALGMLQASRAFRRPGALALGLGVALVVAAPWHVAMGILHGQAFTDVYFGYHLLERASRVLVGEGAGATYAAWVFSHEWPLIVPWIAGAAVGGLAVLRRRPDGLVVLALLAGALLPLAGAATGLPHYLVPVAPAAALAVGLLVERVGVRWPAAASIVAGAWVAAAFVATSGRDLLRPDYGPGAPAACASLADRGLSDAVAGTWNLHDPAVTWYCNRPGRLYADNPGVLAATRDIPMLASWVVDAGDEDLRALATQNAIVITAPEPLGDLLARAVGLGLRPEVVVNARTRLAVRLSVREAPVP